MKKLSYLLLTSLLLTACSTGGSVLSTLPADDSRPLGINKDFLAVYESREGTRSTTINVAQSGTGFVLQRKFQGQTTLCSNLSGQTECRTSTGQLMLTDDTQRVMQIESASLRRFLLRERVLTEGEEPKREPVPNQLHLFKKEAFASAFQAMVDKVSDATLEECFQKTNDEEREYFCFGDNLMPFWASTTFTPLGDVTLLRALQAYTERTLTDEQLQSILENSM